MPAKLRLHAAPATFVSLAVILAFGAAGVVALSSASTSRSRVSGSRRSAPAASPQPKCGDTITADVTLHHNLVNCPNNGIIIGADNVTLDLNYHTIDGDAAPCTGCHPRTELTDIGVVNHGHDGVTVVHGAMRQFNAGVVVAAARHNRLLGLSSSRNRNLGFFFQCVRCLVQNSAGNRTKGVGDQVGMLMFQSHHDRILNSSFRHNAGGILSVDNTNTLITGNLFSRNRVDGFFMEGGDGFRITHNRAVRNQESGIALGPGSDNVITRNHVSRAGEGITVAKGHGNLIAHNVVAHTDNGISLGVNGAGPLSGARSVVRRNLVRDSRKDGFFVRNKDRHSRLKGNVAKRSGDDGFDVESRSAKLSNNRAVRNNDLGIEAVRGVADGGGNFARHNGDPRQCTHVACN
jgi:parallel beta-helix repeat protein